MEEREEIEIAIAKIAGQLRWQVSTVERSLLNKDRKMLLARLAALPPEEKEPSS